MPELSLIKRNGLLMPASELDEEIINSMQDGCLYKVKISKVRNPQFHRKYFALLDVLYNFFTPQITPLANGMVPKKNRERFRKDLIIATGNIANGHCIFNPNSHAQNKKEARQSVERGVYTLAFGSEPSRPTTVPQHR